MITSSSNIRIKNVIALKKKPRIRREQDAFLIEGIKMFLEIPPSHIRQVYVTEDFLKKNRERIPAQIYEKIGRKDGYDVVSEKVAEAISDTKTPQGVVAVVRQEHYILPQLLGMGEQKPLLIILEDIQDPGNLGTIIRSCEGAGVTGVLMTGSTADIYNPKVTRATMGAIYRLPFVYTDDLEKDIRYLRDNKITVYAAHLDGLEAYDQKSYRGGTAFMIGNESRGLTDHAASLADDRVHIPMLGQVESLNAAVAASLLMYEAARQRREQLF